MKSKISYLLLGIIFAGGILTAFMSEDILIKCIGIITSFASFISGFLTNSEIDGLKEQMKNKIEAEEVGESTDYPDFSDLFNKKENKNSN